MSEDIFIPQSSPDDAVVGPLHTVTYITADKQAVHVLLGDGYGMTASEWFAPSDDERHELNAYLGFAAADTWEACVYSMPGEGANVRIRVFSVSANHPLVRPAYDGLYQGGATISCPMTDMRAHEKHVAGLGIQSTIGVKEMEFTSPTGETYISAEIVYMAPDNVYLMGVTRPSVFVPTGPIDPDTGIGGPAYSARCVAQCDATVRFLADVLGYETRRDVELVVGERSAIRLPEGTKERFIQAFAPGSQTGYVVLMDHGSVTKRSDAESLGPPSRGIGIWSFPTRNLDDVQARAEHLGCHVRSSPGSTRSPLLGPGRSLMIEDPDGFPIEVFETAG